MTRRNSSPLLALLLGLSLRAAAENATVVVPKAVKDPTMKSMVQTFMLGPLQIYSIVYKPRLYPLSGLLDRLARGEFTKALTRLRLRYQRSNVDDKALAALLAHGFIPAFVIVTNTDAKAVNATPLKITLDDDDFSLAAIPNSMLPENFKSLDPKAVAANYYNATMMGVAVVMNVIIAGTNEGTGFELPKMAGGERKVVDPMAKTVVDYNGLLFKPGSLAPGESRRGLLFFKAKGVDWSELKLQASLP